MYKRSTSVRTVSIFHRHDREPCKTVEPIEVPLAALGVWIKAQLAPISPNYHRIYTIVQIPHGKGAFFEGAAASHCKIYGIYHPRPTRGSDAAFCRITWPHYSYEKLVIQLARRVSACGIHWTPCISDSPFFRILAPPLLHYSVHARHTGLFFYSPDGTNICRQLYSRRPAQKLKCLFYKRKPT